MKFTEVNQDDPEENNADQLIKAMKCLILNSPELRQLIDETTEKKIMQKEFPSYFTRDQLARAWQISKKSLDRMTNEELKKLGFTRKKIGVSVRFERASIPMKDICIS
jgi:hypothetical protein